MDNAVPALGAAADHADMLVGEVKEGNATVNELHTALLPVGHQIRMVAFGSTAHPSGRFHTVSLGHALQFIEDYLREHWDVLRHADHKDPVFGFLSMMVKAKQGVAAGVAS